MRGKLRLTFLNLKRDFKFQGCGRRILSLSQEIDRLANNSCLVQIDLRLNPIAKQDADYRLYLINILPSLQVCDDREIKDGEKQMELTYYNHKNLSKFERKPEYELYSKNENNPLIQLYSRVKSISNIVKRSAGSLVFIISFI